MMMWRYINEERDDKSFIGVERVSFHPHETSMYSFQNIDVLETVS